LTSDVVLKLVVWADLWYYNIDIDVNIDYDKGYSLSG